MKEVEFAESAFKHGFAEEDFFELLAGKYIKLRSQRGLAGVYELFGRSLAGEYVHVIYRGLAHEKAIRVFHMSPMTQQQTRRFKRMIRK